MRLTLAVTLAVSLLGLLGFETTEAQQSETSSPFKPLETPKVDLEVFHAPPLDQRPAPQGAAEQEKTRSPASVEIGRYDKYKLDLNAARSSDINSRTGFDSGEASNLSKSLRQGKSEPVAPDYFGLKLTAPTN